MNKIISVGIGVVAVVIVIAAVSLFVLPMTSSSSSSNGVGAPFLTLSQVQSLFGSGGTYNESSTPGAAGLGNSNGVPPQLVSSVSEVWSMNYVTNYGHLSSKPVYGVAERIAQSSNANAVYAYILKGLVSSNASILTTINNSLNGMTFSYGKSLNALGNEIIVIGVSGNKIIMFAAATTDNASIGEEPLVSTIAADLS